MFDLQNRRNPDCSSTSELRCDIADEDDWDLYLSTERYSPRNELYLHAGMMVDMWRQLMLNDQQLDSKSASVIRGENLVIVHFWKQDCCYICLQVLFGESTKDNSTPNEMIELLSQT